MTYIHECLVTLIFKFDNIENGSWEYVKETAT